MSRMDEYGWRDGEWRDFDKITHPGLRKLLGLLEKVQPQQADKPELLGSWMACCPAHDDESPSLSIGWWKNGRVSLHCFAEQGCSRDKILHAIGVAPAEVAPPRRDKSHLVATYSYEDENGVLLYQYLRFAPKTIRARRPNGDGWIYNLGNVRRVLYKLPQLVDAVMTGETIFVCEGEKDVDRLRELGFAATCNPGGAGKWRREYSEFLRSANVVLLQDNDSSGETHVKVIAAAIAGVAASSRVICFSDLPPKSDVSDWLDLGHTADELRRIVADTPTVVSSAPALATNLTALDPDREHLTEDVQGIWTLTQEGRKRLTNFLARIVADVVEDDGAEGRRVFEIDASMAGSTSETFRILAKDFFEMRWHLEHIGASAAVMPNIRSGTARYAIQVLSSPVPRRTVYMHTGWRELESGQFVFLHAAGAIGANGVVENIEVRLEGGLALYALPAPPAGEAEREAALASLSLLDGLASDRVMIPLFAAVWRAPLGGTDFGLHLAGRTGAGKSELAALAQQHFGAGLDARHLPANWSSTANALEGIAFLAKDVLLVVDDFCPRGSRNDVEALQKLAERLFRAQGNSSGRARMRQDSTLRPVKPPRGLVVSTGEDVPTGQSLAARVLIAEVGARDVAFDRLAAAQEIAALGHLARFMSGYIRYLASRMPELRLTQMTEFQRLRTRAVLASAHRRTPSIIAQLMQGVIRFVEYCRSIDVFDSSSAEAFETRAWAALLEAGNLQSTYQAEDSPAGVYLRGVAAALASGFAHLTDHRGGCPDAPTECGWQTQETENGERRQPRGLRIGCIRGSDVYLFQEPSYQVAQRMTEGSLNRLSIGLPRLRRMLWEEGHLKAKGSRGDTNYFQTRVTVEGHRLYALHFDAGDFGIPIQDDAPGGDRREVDPM